MSKESLVANPVRHVLEKNQRHLSIGYDWFEDHLTLKLEGVDAADLPPAWKSDEIFANKIVDIPSHDTR